MYHKIKVIIIRQIAPGIPSIPTIIDVKKFKPMWKPHIPAIRLIANIINPPKIELKINFIINFKGTIKIFPIINKKQMQAKKIIVLSIRYNPFKYI